MTPSRVIWLDGEFVPWEDAKVHVLSHALHYGSGVFEGIRAYPTDRGPAIFRLQEHMARLVRGCRAYGIPLELTADELIDIAVSVVAENGLDDGCYIRPLVFLGLGSIGLNPAGASTHVMVAAWEWGAYLGEDGVRNGIRGRFSSWRRIDQASLIPSAKGTGAYLNSILAKSEAVAAGYDEALMLNTQGFIAEGSGENVFVITDGAVATPPTSDGCLNGITRNTAITLLEAADIEVREQSLTRASLYYADEVFLVGTAAEVTPLREVDDRPIGTGEPGPITRMVQEAYADVVRGKVARYDHWLTYVKGA
ncbi:MAG: branched-chain amino acid transaminase [Acidimicrobiia bacterium]